MKVFAAIAVVLVPVLLHAQLPEDISRTSNTRLCNAFYEDVDRARARAELERRGIFKDLEWQAIDAGTLAVGIREEALICALGQPGVSRRGDVRTFTSALGTRKTYIYRSSGLMVHLERGRVSAWSY